MLQSAFLLKLKSTSWLIYRNEQLSLAEISESISVADKSQSAPYIFKSGTKEYQGYSLAACLSLTTEALSKDDYAIILKDRALAFGFKGEFKKITLTSEEPKPLPAPLATPFYKEYVYIAGGIVPILKLDEIVAFITTAPQPLKPPCPSLAFWSKATQTLCPHLTIFKRKGLSWALNGELLEVISARKITVSPYPLTPPLLQGLYRHRQALIPVFELGRIGLKDSRHSLDDLLLIIDLQERLTGLLACRLINALPCTSEDFIPAEPTSEFIKGFYRYRGKKIPVLWPEALLAQEADLARLGELSKDENVTTNSIIAELTLTPDKVIKDRSPGSLGLKTTPSSENLKTAPPDLSSANTHPLNTEASPNTYNQADFEPRYKRPIKTRETRSKRKHSKALWLVVGIVVLLTGLSLFGLFLLPKDISWEKGEQVVPYFPTTGNLSPTPKPSPRELTEQPLPEPTPGVASNPSPLNRELQQDDYGYYYIYEVKPGDILANIAWQETGKYENLRLIAKDNLLADPDLILPHQKLKIYVKRK